MLITKPKKSTFEADTQVVEVYIQGWFSQQTKVQSPNNKPFRLREKFECPLKVSFLAKDSQNPELKEWTPTSSFRSFTRMIRDIYWRVNPYPNSEYKFSLR